jgi:1-aminocyclopropane-1-carboxylate deaminase/D-cysteine desulfhydrase-like pyridoxal-dependent ACC family enzyme
MDPVPWPERHRLLDGPSPFHPLRRFSAALGDRAEVWVKREDLLPIGLGGNKLRNLEFLIGDALLQGADTLVTSGRRWSNHARLTAAAGAVAGLQVHLVLTGPPDAAARSSNVRLCELLGATVHVAGSADRAHRARLVLRVVEDLRAAGRVPYLIGIGGSGLLGALGQVLAARELVEQAAANGIGVDVVVVPSATGGTQAGLLAGLHESSAGSGALPVAVEGFAVAQPADELQDTIAALLEELRPYVPAAAAARPIRLDPAQLGEGYGVRSSDAEDAATLLARTEGILVDPIYTAKALAGLVDRVRSGAWDGRRIVFWHAGGLPGVFEPLDGPG